MATDRPILLVEDNPDDEVLTLRAFAKNKIANQIVVAHDGMEAVNYLFGIGPHTGRDMSVQPAVVFLDLKLPRIDGLEVLRRIRADARTRLLPVVILTTSRELQDIEEANRLGVNSYVRKPIDFEQFLFMVGQLGQYWLGFNELAEPHPA